MHSVCIVGLHVTVNYNKIECCTTMRLWQMQVDSKKKVCRSSCTVPDAALKHKNVHLPVAFFRHAILLNRSYLSIQYSALRPVQQEPEPSQVTGMALARCILGKFLGVGCHFFFPPSPLGAFTSNDARDFQQRKVELFVGEKCFNKFHLRIGLPLNSNDLLHAVNLRYGKDGFTSPPKEGVLKILYSNV